MEKNMITSETNSIIKYVKSLQLKKNRMKHMQFTVEGLRIVEECVKHNGDIAYIIYSEEIYSTQGAEKLLDKIALAGYTLYEVSSQLFSKISTTENPQGIMAVVHMKNRSLEEIKSQKGKELFFVILDRIQDPGNMGTIIRTAESANADAVIITKGSVDPYNSKTLRATMGAIFHMPIIQCDDDRWLDDLKENEVKLIAADLDTDKTYIDIDYNTSIGIIIGNEANGISEALLSKVDQRVIIPILGKIESLNASVAASILIYKAAEEKYFKHPKSVRKF